MMFELLPVCYLEGFLSLNKLVKQKPWPQSPRFIFTSNNFDTDEVFKLWTATKVELGCKNFVGQHGNNYGTHRYMYPAIEEATADKFLTWGWTDGLAQHMPAFIFKTIGKKAGNYNPGGGLLLIELHLNHRITTWDGTAEFADYFHDQQLFVSKLAIAPKKNLTIRLHSAHKYMNWNEEARWKAFDPSVKIGSSDGAISDLISNNRLVVHSYDSTGILETLSQREMRSGLAEMLKHGLIYDKNYDFIIKIDKDFRELLNKATVLLSISDYMAQEYENRYGKKFITFHNPIHFYFYIHTAW